MSKKNNPSNKPSQQSFSAPKQAPQKKATTTPSKSMLPNMGGLPWLAVVVVVLAIATYFSYTPAFDNDFVSWDDQVYVEENPLILNPTPENNALLWKTPISLNYHPLTMASLARDAASPAAHDEKGKILAAPFIATNIWIHVMNTILVAFFIWLLSQGNLFVSAFAAAVFGLHPMHVESVAWVSERKDVLYTFFFLLSLIAYTLWADTKKWWWIVLSLGLFVLSCLSKAMAVSLAPTLLLIDYWRGRKLLSAGVLIEKIPFFAVALFFGMMAMSVQSGGDFGGMMTLTADKGKATNAFETFSIMDRFRFASYGFTQYLLRFIWPSGLCTLYPYPTMAELYGTKALTFWLSLLTFFGTLGLTAWSARYTKLFVVGIGFYFVTVAMVLQFLSVGIVIMADRYTYIPYIGIAFLVGMLLVGLEKKFPQLPVKYALWGLLGACSLFWIFKTQKQADTWQNSETLWRNVLSVEPTADQAYANLGNWYGKTGKIDQAIQCFNDALKDGTDRADIFEGLGNAYGSKGDAVKAIEMFSQALKIDPTKGNYYFNRGTAYLQTGNYPLAIEDFSKAYTLQGVKQAGENLARRALCYLNSQNFAKAIEDYNASIKAGGRPSNDYVNRGKAKYAMGDKAGAKADFQEAARMDPRNQEAQALSQQQF